MCACVFCNMVASVCILSVESWLNIFTFGEQWQCWTSCDWFCLLFNFHFTHYRGWLTDIWDTVHPKGFGQISVTRQTPVRSKWTGSVHQVHQQTLHFHILTIIAHLNNFIHHCIDCRLDGWMMLSKLCHVNPRSVDFCRSWPKCRNQTCQGIFICLKHVEITELFQYLRVSSDDRELALRKRVFTRTWCCTARSRWPVSPQLDQHQSPSPRLQMSIECWCVMAHVLMVYLETTCLLVSQCYCEHFCQDIWNGARLLRLRTQLFPAVPSNTAAAVFLCVFKHSAHVVSSLLSS